MRRRPIPHRIAPIGTESDRAEIPVVMTPFSGVERRAVSVATNETRAEPQRTAPSERLPRPTDVVEPTSRHRPASCPGQPQRLASGAMPTLAWAYLKSAPHPPLRGHARHVGRHPDSRAGQRRRISHRSALLPQRISFCCGKSLERVPCPRLPWACGDLPAFPTCPRQAWAWHPAFPQQKRIRVCNSRSCGQPGQSRNHEPENQVVTKHSDPKPHPGIFFPSPGIYAWEHGPLPPGISPLQVACLAISGGLSLIIVDG